MQTCSDSRPAAYISDCNRYVVSRAIMSRGVVYDAWLRVVGDRGRDQLPVPLGSALQTSEEAISICETHASNNR